MSAARQAALAVANGAPLVDSTTKASRRFVQDFGIVTAYYGMTPTIVVDGEAVANPEYEAARDAARADMDNAITTYAALAAEIREGNT